MRPRQHVFRLGSSMTFPPQQRPLGVRDEQRLSGLYGLMMMPLLSAKYYIARYLYCF